MGLIIIESILLGAGIFFTFVSIEEILECVRDKRDMRGFVAIVPAVCFAMFWWLHLLQTIA